MTARLLTWSYAVIVGRASPVLAARRYTSSSEAASLQGYVGSDSLYKVSSQLLSTCRKPALTPIIAGSICGGLLFISWTIGFIVYFRKRINRKKRKRLIAAGKAQPREKDLKILQEKVVIPPDPAVLLGHRKGGEVVFPEREHSSPGRMPWTRNNFRAIPESSSKGTASTSGTSGMPHTDADAKQPTSDGPVDDTSNRPKLDIQTNDAASSKPETNDHSPETDQVSDVMTVPAKV
jgi:hypothetical protein